MENNPSARIPKRETTNLILTLNITVQKRHGCSLQKRAMNQLHQIIS
jgi:hypothetical protein